MPVTFSVKRQLQLVSLVVVALMARLLRLPDYPSEASNGSTEGVKFAFAGVESCPYAGNDRPLSGQLLTYTQRILNGGKGRFPA